MNSSNQILRAAWVVPISGPPLADAEVIIDGGRIAEVRPEQPAGTDHVEDFGYAILLPGLVNIHTHLDYTLMRGLLEDLEFFPWIREITARALSLTGDDWLASARWGAAEALASGVTTIGDCTFSGAAFTAAREFGLRGTVYQEVFGIDTLRTVDAIVAELRERVERMLEQRCDGLLSIGISPHAPYTVRPDLMRALAAYADAEGLPVCVHAAESQAEAQLLRLGTGPFAEMYARRGIEWTAPGGSAVAYLDSLGILTDRTLLVHGVQVSVADRELVRRRGAAWAHCPKSNAKLGAGVAPLGLLRGSSAGEPGGKGARDVGGEGAGAWNRVGLGSDSVASNNTMDLFEEMRFAVLTQRAARRSISALSARDALEMATIGGAAALGLERDIGTIEPGKRADLCAVRLDELHSAPAYDPYSALVYAARASDVIATVIDGRPRYHANVGPTLQDRFPANEIEQVRHALRAATRKMRDWRPPT